MPLETRRLEMSRSFFREWKHWLDRIASEEQVYGGLEAAALASLPSRQGLVLQEQSSAGRIFSINLPFLSHPIQVRAGTSDMEVLWEVFARGIYDVSFVSGIEPRAIVDA